MRPQKLTACPVCGAVAGIRELRRPVLDRLNEVIRQFRQTLPHRANVCSSPDCAKASIVTIGAQQWCLMHLPVDA